MNKLLDYIRRLSPVSIMLASLVLGMVIGMVVLGWCLFPVQWYDTDPADLRLEHQKDYLLMAADSYALVDDVELARERLSLLVGNTTSAEDVTAILDDLVGERMAQGDTSGADRLSVLAGLQVLQPSATTATPAPSVAERLKTPVGMGIALGTMLLLIALVGVLWMRRRAKARPLSARRSRPRKKLKTDRKALRQVSEDLPAAEPEPSGDVGTLEAWVGRETAVAPVMEEPSPILESEPVAGVGVRAVSAPETEVEPEGSPVGGEGEPLGEFVSEYVKGELDFDTSFGIEGPEGEFLGECGMGITNYVGDKDSRRVGAFEIWLFDKGDIRTVSKVLVSEYAYRDQAVRAKLSAKGELVVARPGESLQLETLSLRMVAQIVASEYGESDDLPPGSFFSRLKVKLIPSVI